MRRVDHSAPTYVAPDQEGQRASAADTPTTPA
jgi:hypothetical protein